MKCHNSQHSACGWHCCQAAGHLAAVAAPHCSKLRSFQQSLQDQRFTLCARSVTPQTVFWVVRKASSDKTVNHSVGLGIPLPVWYCQQPFGFVAASSSAGDHLQRHKCLEILEWACQHSALKGPGVRSKIRWCLDGAAYRTLCFAALMKLAGNLGYLRFLRLVGSFIGPW